MNGIVNPFVHKGRGHRHRAIRQSFRTRDHVGHDVRILRRERLAQSTEAQ